MSNTSLQAFFFSDFQSAFIPHILKEVYLDRIYEPFLRFKKDLTIVDVGANIGLTSYYFKDRAKRVIAVEPSAQHRACIEAMIKQNNIKNIEIYPYALSSENGTAKFYHNDNTTMFSLKSEVNKKDDFEEVQTVTMDKLLSDLNIDRVDLMKLDVEGSESEIISSEGFKKSVDKLPVILGEWHTWSAMGANLFRTTLMDLGYEFNWLNKTEASTFSAVRN